MVSRRRFIQLSALGAAVPMRVPVDVSATPMTPVSTGAKLAALCNTSACREA